MGKFNYPKLKIIQDGGFDTFVVNEKTLIGKLEGITDADFIVAIPKIFFDESRAVDGKDDA